MNELKRIAKSAVVALVATVIVMPIAGLFVHSWSLTSKIAMIIFVPSLLVVATACENCGDIEAYVMLAVLQVIYWYIILRIWSWWQSLAND